MCFQRQAAFVLFLVFSCVVAPVQLGSQTTINVNSSTIQPSIKRFGINLGSQSFYDSGQMLKNLVFTNPSFEGEIYQSTIQCVSGTANSCTDANSYSGFTPSFWANASYTVISGAAVNRTGTICSFTGGAYPVNGGIYTFCDSGTAPSKGDYMVVKRIMPPSIAWPNGDWQTVVGNGSLGAETSDLPPGTLGKQSAILTAPTASDSIALNTFFDSTAGKTFVQLNGSYQLTFKAKGVAGSNSIAVNLTRANAGLTYINQTIQLTNAWAPYTINFQASENGTAIGRVELSFTTVGADTVELDDISLQQTNTDPTNTTVFRDEVVNALQSLHPGTLRMWEDQLGQSLDNLLAAPTGRQRSAYTPYNGYDGTDFNFQTQGVQFGLTDFLQLCQKVGADPWIVVPSTFSTGEAYSLIDYLAGSSATSYGAIRAAAGQAAPWTSVFHQIHLEFGNEEWNGGTFKGGAIELAPAYGQRATAIFAAMKGNPSYVASSFDLIVNGQSATPYNNQVIQSYTLNNDSFSVAPYMMYDITSFDTVDHLFGTTFAEAEAFVTSSSNSSSEGVAGGYISQEQLLVNKPIVTSEMNLSPSAGTMTQTALNSYASSIGGGIAVLDSMFQQLRAGVLTQNLFELPGYIANTAQSPSNTMYLWGAVVDMGVTNRKRPQYLALQLANSAIGNATSMLQTVHTGADPTDNQYDYGLNSVTLPAFHFLQSFAFTGNGTNSLVVFNVNPDYSEQVNFAGPNAPTGTVVMQQLTSGNITDNNELSNVVGITSTTLANFNGSANMTLPPYSMTVFTWGGSVQGAPSISGINVTGISSNGATINWTTDQLASTSVSYGTTTSYGTTVAGSSTLSTAHSVTLTGLTPGTTYDFDVTSANSSNASSTSSNSTFATTAAAAPIISGVSVTAISSTGATISWITDQSASTSVSYGTTTSYGTTVAGSSTLSTAHSVTLTGLTPGTTYDFDVTSANSSHASSTSTNSTFATTAAAAPIISGVSVTAISSTGATISWTTDQSASTSVSYGTTTSYGTTVAGSGTLSTTHSVTLTGLTPGTTYDFDVTSANSSNISSTSANSTFATTAAAAPIISGISVTAISSTGATISWTTDQSASTSVSYGTTTSYGATVAGSSTLSTTHSVTLTGLTPGTTYDFDVTSANSSNVSSTSANSTFATTAAAAPIISGVSVTAISSTGATISWTTDQLASTSVSYGTTTSYGTTVAGSSTLSTTHSVTLTGLTTGTTYDFDVTSANSSNVSSTSANSSFMTSQSVTGSGPVITNEASWPVADNTATILWTTDQNATSQVNYGPTSTYGSQTPLNSSLGLYHSVPLIGLNSGTTYHYQVISTNASGATSISPDFSFATSGMPSTTPAPIVSAVTPSAITTTSATITWMTDQAATAQVSYGTTPSYGLLSTPITTLSNMHSVTLTGLIPGTTYDYVVISANSSNVSATSGNYSFTTAAIAGATVITNEASWPVGNNTATILWTTDQNATSQVNYGTTSAYGLQTPLNSTLGLYHSVPLTSLNSGTTYHYQVVSTNSSGVTSTSPDFSFTTTGVAVTGPMITIGTPSGITSNSVTINWTTDQLSTSQVSYGTSTSYGSMSSLNSTLTTSHSVTLTGLMAGTTYNYAVISANSSAVSTTSGNFTFTTTTAVTTAPVISQVASSGISSTSATITWSTDQGSSSLVNYGTSASYGLSSAPNSALVTQHSVTLTGLMPNTAYNYDVVSTNATNNTTTSANYMFTTKASSNGPAPVISYLAFWSITSNSVTISWSTDVLSTTQVAYGTTASFGQTSPLQTTATASHGVILTNLSPGTTYYFAAQSSDQSGNTGYSTTYSFTTLAGPPSISGVTVAPAHNNTATISWATSAATYSYVQYGPTTSYGRYSAQTSLTTSPQCALSYVPSGVIHYQLVSTDAYGNQTTTPDATFMEP